MSRFKLLYFVIFVINLYKTNAQISDKRLCVDEECKVPISLAKTLLRYSSPDSRILSFAPNVDITIYSKSAGSREDLWGGEINGKRGYVPKHMVRETRILQKPTLLVATEFNNETETTQVPSQVEPDKVQEPYEVVDGTTIYLNPQDSINPTATDSPVQSTALPVETTQVGQTEAEVVTDNPSQDQQAVDSEGQDTVTSTETQTDEPEEKPEEDDSKDAFSAEDEDEELSDDEEIEDEEDDEEDELTEDVENAEDLTPEADVNKETDEAGGAQVKTETEEDSVKEDSETINLEDTEKVEQRNILSLETSSENLVFEDPRRILTSENNNEKVLTEELQVPVVENSATDAQNLNSEEINSEKETPENAIPVESVQLNEETSPPYNEPTIPTDVEVTTISSEIEVPPPYDDTILEVTQNPLEQVPEQSNPVQETVPTMPPLFANLNTDSGIKIEDSQEIIQSENISEEVTEPSISEETTNSVAELAYVNLNQNFVAKEAPIPETSNENAEKVVENVSEIIQENSEEFQEKKEEVEETTGPGFFARVMSFFGSGSEENVITEPQIEEKEKFVPDHVPSYEEKHVPGDDRLSSNSGEPSCDATSCPKNEESSSMETSVMDLFNFNSDILLYLVTTAVSVIIFLFGYIAFDKSKREGPLVAKINKLEKELLIVVKENQILQEKVATDSGYENNDRVSNEVVENLKQDLLEVTSIKTALEEQVQSLEKELENSTEVGMELNRMLSEILSSESGSDVLQANVEHLQRQLVEQQSTINSNNESLAITNTENHELRLELELSNKKVLDLQAELDKLLLNILKIEEEKETQQNMLENDITNFRQKYEDISNKLRLKDEEYNAELKQVKERFDQTERKLELKTKEHDVLKDTLKQLKNVKNNEATLKNLLDVGNMKAELQLLKSENVKFSEKIQQEQAVKSSSEKKAHAALAEIKILKENYEEADKMRVEAQTKLEVLSNYFKDREAQWQKEISKHEALWAERAGEATSTTERIKFMQEQLQNYKAQRESLKQEIMSQEIELKSQISVLEKKAHENWVSARQAERKLEEAKQEAAQLRHRLTLRERAIQEDKSQQRLQSPIEQNGDMPLESPASPPLLYGTRDHITKSPPISGLPPFLPGVSFMPPPPLHGVPPPFIPPHPTMFPVDHRPPPLGRMSSPPLNSRYSPSSRGYSPYDGNSSSPSDSEYGTSPPHRRAYSPFNSRTEDRREYKRAPPGRTNGRNLIKGGASSGSGHSNESLEKISRQQSKV